MNPTIQIAGSVKCAQGSIAPAPVKDVRFADGGLLGNPVAANMGFRVWRPEPPVSRAESVAPKKSKAAWKIEIKQTHRSGKNANHALSRIVFEATTDLAYGGWTEMWEGEDRPFAVRKAHDLAFVGENVTSLLRLDQAELCLPTALSTLCILGHLPPQILLDLIESGRIDRKLKRKKAEALLEEFDPQPKLPPKPLKVRPVIARILRQLRVIKSNATPADAEFAMKRVQAMINQPFANKPQISSLSSHLN